jgi:integrase
VCATTVSHWVTLLARQAGVKLTMHSLRRGYGCRYAGKVPAQVLQGLLRHASIKTTMNYYANVEDAVMEAVLGPKKPDLCNDSRNKADKPAGCRDGYSAATPYDQEVSGQ